MSISTLADKTGHEREKVTLSLGRSLIPSGKGQKVNLVSPPSAKFSISVGSKSFCKARLELHKLK